MGPCYSRLLELFWRYRSVRPFLSQAEGLPMSAFFMMHGIALCGKTQEDHGEETGVRISEISRRTNMSMPAVSQMLNSLEGKGLVVRSMTKNDRRAVFVTLTPTGKALLEEARQDLFATMEEVERRMGKEETDQLIQLSMRLFDIMDEMRDQKKSEGKGESTR